MKSTQSKISLSTSKKNWYYNNLIGYLAQKGACIVEYHYWNNRLTISLLSKYRLVKIAGIFNIFMNLIEFFLTSMKI